MKAIVRSLLAIGLLACAMSSGAVPLQGATSTTDPGFDFFYLTMGWPASMTWQRHPPGQPVHSWFLHGLWPNFNNGSWPSFCNSSEPFVADKIQDLVPEMETFWPAVLSDTEDEFWGHEWEKHGTCSVPVLASEHSYFETVLNIRKQLNLVGIMKNAGMSPSETPYFTAVQFANAFGKVFGYMPDLRCGKDSKGVVGLHELWLCLDTNLKFMDCPPESHSHGQQYAQCGDGTLQFQPYTPQI